MREATRHPGARHWLLQRFSSILLLPLGAWFVVALAGRATAAPSVVRAWIGEPITATLLLSLLGIAAWHLVQGARVVADDYVPDPVQRRLLMQGVTVVAWGSASLGALAVLGLALRIA